MAFQHTTSKSAGDLYDDGPYTHAKIMQYLVDLRGNQMTIWVEHGKVDEDGNFVPGKATEREAKIYRIVGEAYSSLVSANQATYTAAKNALYQHLQDEEGFIGTVV